MSEKVYCRKCIYYARACYSEDYGTFCPIPVSYSKDWYSDNVKIKKECEVKNKNNDCKDYHEYFWRRWFK